MPESILSSRRAAPSSPRTPRVEELAGGCGGDGALAIEDDDESKTRTHGTLSTRLSRMLCYRISQSRRSCSLLMTLLLVLVVALFIRHRFGRGDCDVRDDSISRRAIFSGSIEGLASDFGILGVPWCRSKHGKTVEWGPKDLVKGLEEFVPIYETRAINNNTHGMGFDHSFGLWFMARWLKPVLMIESVAFEGHSTWVLRQAMPETRIISLSPRHSEKYLMKGPIYIDGNCTYFTGKDSVDFGSVNWRNVVEKHGVSDINKVLVFFDDHQNQLKRLKQALKFGFQHLIFGDNCDTGTGDHYSLRQICDQFYVGGGGHSCFMDGDEARVRRKRRKMWEKAVDVEELCGNGETWWGVRGEMRDDFNQSNKVISYLDHFHISRFVESLLDIYWELPPVAGPSLTHQTRYDPARTTIPIVEDGQYSLFRKLGLTALDASVFNEYTQMVYVKEGQRSEAEDRGLKFGLRLSLSTQPSLFFSFDTTVALQTRGERHEVSRGGRESGGSSFCIRATFVCRASLLQFGLLAEDRWLVQSPTSESSQKVKKFSLAKQSCSEEDEISKGR